jgi:O-antigen/teichoic acid export membrane protein
VPTRIVGATLVVLAGSGMALLASLGARVLLARLLAPADVGLLLLGLGLVTAAGSLAGLGLNLPLTRRIAALRTAALRGADPWAPRRTAWTAAVTAIAAGLVAAGLVFAASPFIAPLLAPAADAPRLAAALRALCPVVVALPLGLAGLGINRGYGGVAARALLRDTLGGALRLAGIAAAALLSGSLAALGIAYSSAVLVSEGLFLAHGLRSAGRRVASAVAPRPSLPSAVDGVSLPEAESPPSTGHLDRPLLAALPPFFHLEILHQTEQWLDLMVVGLFASPREVALYGLARALTRSMDLVRLSASHRFFPAATGARASGASERFADVYRRSRFLVLAILWLPLLACLLVPGLLMATLFGPTYEPAGSLLSLLALAVLLEGLFGFKDQSLVVLDKEGGVLRVRLLAQVVAVLVLFLTVPRWGAVGAAVAVLGAQAVRSTGFTLMLRRTGALPPLRREFPPRALAALGLAATAGLGVALLPAVAALPVAGSAVLAGAWLLLRCAGLDLRHWRAALSS